MSHVRIAFLLAAVTGCVVPGKSESDDDDGPDGGAAGDYPETFIDLAPGQFAPAATVELRFSSDDPDATFVCGIDGAVPAACASPYYAVLVDGPHLFSVAAVVDGRRDQVAATTTWVTDTTPPVVTITGTQGLVATADASFQLASEATASFSCRLDGGTPWGCPASFQLTGLAQGSHSLVVTAVDGAGHSSQNPVVRTWTVDTVPPETFLSQPPDTAETQVPMTLSASESNVTYRCRVDSDQLVPCSASHFLIVDPGPHTYHAIATDAAGNEDPDGVTVTWTVL